MENHSKLFKTVQLFNCTDTIFFFERRNCVSNLYKDCDPCPYFYYNSLFVLWHWQNPYVSKVNIKYKKNNVCVCIALSLELQVFNLTKCYLKCLISDVFLET